MNILAAGSSSFLLLKEQCKDVSSILDSKRQASPFNLDFDPTLVNAEKSDMLQVTYKFIFMYNSEVRDFMEKAKPIVWWCIVVG